MKSFSSFLLLLTIFLLGVPFNSLAKAEPLPRTHLKAMEHLSTVNQEWVKQNKKHSNEIESFATDAERIQYHLNAVITDLRKNYNSNLNKAQLKNRFYLLDKLEVYANEKLFPENIAFAHRLPCFVDAKNTHCAVGYMMKVSGNSDLVARINAAHQYDYIADIKTAGVNEWADEFGFTLDELAWIQPAYPPEEEYDSLSNGTNGPVKKISKMVFGSGFIFSGDFTTVDDLPCLNIGKYEDGVLSCLGGGIEGTVNGLFEKYEDGIYVHGELIHEGTTYPMAKYKDGVWQYLEIPTREGAVSSAGIRGNSTYTILIAISHPSIIGQEIWYLDDADEWQKSADIEGVILTTERTNSGFAFVGSFSGATTYEDGVILEQPVNNILIKKFYPGWIPINEAAVSDTIKSIKTIGATIYFGGSASEETESDVCLSRYTLGTMQPLLNLSHFYGHEFVSFNALEFYESTQLIIGGKFHTLVEFGADGKNLASYDLVLNRLTPISLFDAPVNTILSTYGELYVGGDFITNLYSPTNYNHLARLKPSTVGVEELSNDSKMTVYPNPFTDKIRLTHIEDGSNYTLINNLGQIVRQGHVTNQNIDHLDALAHGHYILKVESKGDVYTNVLVK